MRSFLCDCGSLLSEICWDILLENAQSFSIPAKTKGWNLQIVGFVLESRAPSQNLWYTLPETNMKPPKIEMEVWFHALFPFLPIWGPIFQVFFVPPFRWFRCPPLKSQGANITNKRFPMKTWRRFFTHLCLENPETPRSFLMLSFLDYWDDSPISLLAKSKCLTKVTSIKNRLALGFQVMIWLYLTPSCLDAVHHTSLDFHLWGDSFEDIASV